VRTALRLSQLERAEAQLMKIGTIYANDPEYLNLVGVFHEMHRRLKEAKSFYGKAIATHKHYEPAQHNLQRIYELEEFGQSQKQFDLG
jgi:Flp pilus assembly protein TadD